MFNSLYKKTIYDKRWFMIGWSIGSVALLALTAAFYPTIAENIGDLFKSIPSSLSSLVGEADAYRTYAGYMASAVFGIRAEMLFAPLAIILALGLSVNEELSRRMYQLLAQPISRDTIVIEKWLAGLSVIFFIMAVVVLSLILTTVFINETLPGELLPQIGAMSFLFTAAIFSLTYGIGMATGIRSLAIIVPVAWIMSSLLIESFSGQVPVMKDISWLSVLQYYNTGAIVEHGIDFKQVMVLLSITTLPVVIALLCFKNRDIKEAE